MTLATLLHRLTITAEARKQAWATSDLEGVDALTADLDDLLDTWPGDDPSAH